MSLTSPDAKAVVRALDALTTQVRRIADALTTPVVTSQTTTCDASTLGVGNRHLGPCVLRDGHDGPVHRGPEGETWATVVAEAQPTTADDGPRIARPVPLATPCGHCGHPYNWHASRGACEFGHEDVRCGCDTFTVGERPEPIDPARILGAEAPAADDDQTPRWARRESLLVLLTRLQRGRTLTEDEALTLRQHAEAEMREAEQARARVRQLEDDYAQVARWRNEQAERADQAEAEGAAAVKRAELADAVTAETKRLLERRTTTLRERAKRAEAATERARALASRWAVLRAYGSATTELLAALDGTEQPTTQE